MNTERHRPAPNVVSLQKLRLPVELLQVGMFVCELDRPWLESPFLLQGFRLKNEEDIAEVQRVCKYVYVEVSKETAIQLQQHIASSRPITTIQPAKSGPRPPLTAFTQEMKRAQGFQRHASKLVRNIMDDVRLGQAIDTRQAKAAVSECVDSVIANADALLLLTRLKNKDEYTSEHSLNVALQTIAFGRHLGMEREALEEVGLCAMLHDVGKMLVPDQVLKKQGRLTAEEFAQMREHANHGHRILLNTAHLPKAAQEVAYGHHERLDGSGYPRQLDAERISYYTRIVAITDTYDAITSDRCYQNGRTTLEAFRIMERENKDLYDANLIIKFIQCIGIYPPGSLVEMANGEVGLITNTDTGMRLRPNVLLLLSEDKRQRPPRLINMSKMSLDAEGKPYRIANVLRDGSYGIHIHSLLELGLLNHLGEFIQR